MSMMGCGHIANAVQNSRPVCVICLGVAADADVVVEGPNLEDRFSTCSCRKIVPSNTKLAFFEYRGPNSVAHLRRCGVCNYWREAHETGKIKSDHEWIQGEPYQYDSHYDGCRGWD